MLGDGSLTSCDVTDYCCDVIGVCVRERGIRERVFVNTEGRGEGKGPEQGVIVWVLLTKLFIMNAISEPVEQGKGDSYFSYFQTILFISKVVGICLYNKTSVMVLVFI